MSIKTINDDGSFVSYCPKCGNDQTIAAAAVQKGITIKITDPDNPPAEIIALQDPDTIVCPPCPTPGCGAVKYLAVPRDQIPARFVGGVFDRQRRAVSALGEKLKALGRVDPENSAAVNALAAPPDIMEVADVTDLAVPVPRRFVVRTGEARGEQ